MIFSFIILDLVFLISSIIYSINTYGINYPYKFLCGICPLTLLSFIQMIFISFFTLNIFFLRAKISSFSYILWALISLGFFYLALDEIFRMHDFINQIIFRDSAKLSVLMYATVGVFIFFLFKKEILRFKSSLLFLLSGGFFVLLSIFLDLTSRNPWSQVCEESFEVFAGTLFLIGFYNCYKSIPYIQRTNLKFNLFYNPFS